MRWSQYFIPTLREDPADAEVVSHKLLLRAGIIRQLSAGIYSYLPLGQRAVLKVMQILREEMNAIGGEEIFLPPLPPPPPCDGNRRIGSSRRATILLQKRKTGEPWF